MRPGTNIFIQSQLPPSTPPVNTGTWFVAGVTSQGPVAPKLALSFAQWQSIYGGRGTNPLLSDSVETYFAQGGSQVITARVVGPSAVSATITLKDSAAANSCSVTAIGPGSYANGYQVVVAASGGTYTITIEDASGNVLEQSNTLTTVTDAVTYGASSSYVTIAAIGTTVPVAATAVLTGGADDAADITTTQWSGALAEFLYSYGPGIVSLPGQTTTALLTAIATHCNTAGPPGFRVGAGDLPDVSAAATLAGDASSIRALGQQGRCVSLWAPWADIAPVSGSAANRAVPPSAFYAGKAAYNDGSNGNPNLPIAGLNGILDTVVDLHQVWSDPDRQTLNTAGVNVIRAMAGGFRIYGNVTVVDRIADPLYFQLANARLDMAILADINQIQEEYEFSEIDGQGIDASNFGNALVSMMTSWFTLGALFGPDGTADTAFSVDWGSDVNTPTTEAEGELIATVAYARSPGAEQVNVNIVRASAATGV